MWFPFVPYRLAPGLGSQGDGVRASLKCPVPRHVHLIDQKRKIHAKGSQEGLRPGTDALPAKIGWRIGGHLHAIGREGPNPRVDVAIIKCGDVCLAHVIKCLHIGLVGALFLLTHQISL